MNIDAVKGMNDILPKQIHIWQKIETIVKDVLMRFCFDEIRMPILEYTNLFARSIGEVTDIVSKEMFTFEDRLGKASYSLRPEGTAGCVRACVQHSLIANNQQQKLWYMGSMFRYERPQKGRYRQFHQLGVETFNVAGVNAELEQLLLMQNILQILNIEENVTLKINSIGNFATRNNYKQALVEYLMPYHDELDPDSQNRLKHNPLRILDSKIEKTQEILLNAPKITEFLGAESLAHYMQLKQSLTQLNIKFIEDHKLVRGLDYYNDTVFEWVSNDLGSQNAIGGGGRYDGLGTIIGNMDVKASGFAIGLERLLLVYMAKFGGEKLLDQNHAYLICSGESDTIKLLLAAKIRNICPNIKLDICMQDALGFKAQFKKADKVGAAVALIIGADELANNSITVKFLRDSEKQQITIPFNELNKHLQEIQ